VIGEQVQGKRIKDKGLRGKAKGKRKGKRAGAPS